MNLMPDVKTGIHTPGNCKKIVSHIKDIVRLKSLHMHSVT